MSTTGQLLASHRFSGSRTSPSSIAAIDFRSHCTGTGCSIPVSPSRGRLLEAIGADILARALALGIGNHPALSRRECSAVFSRHSWMPPLPALLKRYVNMPLLVLWSVDRGHDSGKPRTAGPFTDPDGPIPWAEHPHRLFVRVNSHSHEMISQAAATWAHQFGARELATVVLKDLGSRSNAGVTELVRGQLKDPDAAQGSPRKKPLGLGRYRGGGISVPSGSANNREMEKQLAEVARALMPKDRRDTVALSAFGDFSNDGPAHQRLASSWAAVLGGFLARDQEARAKRRREALATDTSLQALVKAWEG